MKKFLTFVLAILLVAVIAVPAFAASPTAPEATPTKTSPLPVVADEEQEADCKLISIYDADELTEEERAIFKEAQKTLKAAVPAGMRVKYYFYHWYFKTPVEPCTHILDIGNFNEVVVKQFVEGKWVELDVKVIEDGTISVSDILNGPMAIIVK